jgi:hypothetical protein
MTKGARKKMTLTELGSMIEHFVKSVARIEEKIEVLDSIDTRLLNASHLACKSRLSGFLNLRQC